MKKTLAIFSLTCCKGCLDQMIGLTSELKSMLNFYQIYNNDSIENEWGNYDIGLVEGTPENDDQIKLLRKIRKHCKTVVAVGACANLGGVQSQRNGLPKKLTGKKTVKTVSDFIRVDCRIPGCPADSAELNRCLMDLYWGKKFVLPDLPVCFECQQKNNDCFLKNQKPCLGPITRMGCGSICVDKGKACYGCRGKIAQPNTEKLREMLHESLDDKEIDKFISFYGKGQND